MDRINRAIELLKSHKATEALCLLEKINLFELDDKGKAEYSLALGEASILLGRYDHDFIQAAIEYYRHTSDHQKFAEAKYLKGWQEQSLGMHDAARQSLIEAYSGFLRIEDLANAARSLNRLSFVSFQKGDIDRSIETIRETIDIYDRIGKTKNAISAKNNLAKVLFMSGSLSEAVSINSVSETFIDNLTVRNACAFHLGYSMALALSGKVSAARKRMRLTTKLMEENSREQAQYYEYLGWINLLDGKHRAAAKALASGLELSLKIAPKSALVSQIKRLQADLFIATEKFDLAEQTAKEALVVAEGINERVEIAAVYRVFAQVCAHRNETEQAREWFGKAIDLFALVQSRYELAVTRHISSVSGIYNLSERKAMLYLARNYFESEQLTKWVGTVDSAIKTLTRFTIPRRASNSSTIIGRSPAIMKVFEMIDHVAESHMSILLTGSTGTGKDMFARHIHKMSGFSGEFVSVNMAAIPDEMVEAELFGHSKGAFTGATKERIGLIAQADKGTLYLNEIGDATLPMQAKLLEVIETRKVRRLGENESRAIDFRLITATNVNLDERIRENAFRLDLLHRINEIPILLPDLVDRGDDITLLVTHFVSKSLGRDIQTEDILPFCRFMQNQRWKGNVRELRGDVSRFCTAAGGDLGRLLVVALSDNGRTESDQFKEALVSAGWNRTLTAKLLGISEGTVRNRIRDFAIDTDN